MANNSTRAIALILKDEGGYVNDPKDPGGPTNKGITLATFRRYIKPKATIADLKQLTEAQAIVVYKRRYWDAVCADLLPAGVDYAVADFAVNSGPSRAAKYLQAIVGVAQDGRVGPITIAAVQSLDEVAVIQRLCDDRLAFMRRLRTWPRYKNGWTKRVNGVREVAAQWARDADQTERQRAMRWLRDLVNGGEA